MTYSLTHRSDIVKKELGENNTMLIYKDTGYESYQKLWDEYEAWLAQGNVPKDYVKEVYQQPTLTEKLKSMNIDIAELKTLLESTP